MSDRDRERPPGDFTDRGLIVRGKRNRTRLVPVPVPVPEIISQAIAGLPRGYLSPFCNDDVPMTAHYAGKLISRQLGPNPGATAPRTERVA